MNESVTTATQWISNRLKDKSFQLPERCIVSFFPSLYQYIQKHFNPDKYDLIHKQHPYYIFKYADREIGFIFPGRGAPVSSMILDETITMGAKQFIVIGPCGSLFAMSETPSTFIISKAFSDEGTSKHYSGKEQTSFHASQQILASLSKILQQKNINYKTGNVWTTDAPYRETPDKINQMISRNCIAVDMEFSALYSVAEFYKVEIAGLLTAKDTLSENKWNLNPSIPVIKPSELLHIALETLVNI